MNKLVKVKNDGTVYELFSDHFLDWKKDHAKLIPIDHPDGSIITRKIEDKAITTEKINDQAVTNAKIANLNVTTNKIRDLNVTVGKLANYLNLQGKIILVDTPPI